MAGTGLAVVRIKPLGAGAGGGEITKTGEDDTPAVTVSASGAVRVETRTGRTRNFKYPHHIISPTEGQAEVYAKFMQTRIDTFLGGVNVNVMCYGQTGSGKTHTMFGPPDIMRRAGYGEWGTKVVAEYGIFPRGVMDIMNRVEEMKRRDALSTSYLLTASAVELRFIKGNRDMLRLSGDKQMFVKQNGWSSISDVTISKGATPPTLWGQRELRLNGLDSLLELFRAIASRSTTGTKMNDSSSRSHCFVYLNLYAYDRSAMLLRRSRFQFVDLAGSERMKDAHGRKNYRDCGPEALQGLMCNFGLMMLSQRLRELSAARLKHRNSRVAISSKSQLDPDEISLLSESMSGDANSLIIVCVSSTQDNGTQSINALDFGSEFSKLTLNPRVVKARHIESWRQEADEMALTSTMCQARGASKYALLRESKGRAGRQLVDILDTITGRSEPAADSKLSCTSRGTSTKK